MAFKRSAVRSRVAPPLIRLKKHYVYLNAANEKSRPKGRLFSFAAFFCVRAAGCLHPFIMTRNHFRLPASIPSLIFRLWSVASLLSTGAAPGGPWSWFSRWRSANWLPLEQSLRDFAFDCYSPLRITTHLCPDYFLRHLRIVVLFLVAVAWCCKPDDGFSACCCVQYLLVITVYCWFLFWMVQKIFDEFIQFYATVFW